MPIEQVGPINTDGSMVAKEAATMLVRLGREHTAIAYLLGSVRCVKETTRIPTAAVDSQNNLLFNAKHWEDNRKGYGKSLVVHELLHIAFDYFGRRGERDNRVFNEASDAVINTIISDGFALPVGSDWLMPPANYKGALTSEEIYTYLRQNPREQQSDGSGAAGKGCGVIEAEPSEGEGEPVGDPMTFDLETFKHLAKAGGGSLSKTFERMEAKPAVVPQWKRLIRKTMSAIVANSPGHEHPSYSRVKKRFGAILPVFRGSTPQVAVLIDVSGSMNEQVKNEVITQVVKLANEFSSLDIRVISHTDRVTYSGKARAGTMKAVSVAATQFTGGTDFTGAYAEVERTMPRCTTVIHFTDCEVSAWPSLGNKKLIVCDYGSGYGYGLKPPQGSTVVKMTV